ncbi:MAG: anthranilate phosphoribosyltransferase [Candidatus Omnitrophota bacterium]|jgi:anthranilate phosphoribosyltransferase
MIDEAIKQLQEKKDLNRLQMEEVMEEIMSGKLDTPQIVSFLIALEDKGQTVDEITAAVVVMRRHVRKVPVVEGIVLDTCGTGGDQKGIFNVSTAVAFVASGCGIRVAKHGNRSVSSRSGSADILEALGVNLNVSPEKLSASLKDINIAFLFAQNLHPAMKYAMPARKQIARKTIFNILGPLTNPAGARHQLVGVYEKSWTKKIAHVLLQVGALHALVVHGEDGLDEVTTTAATEVAEVHNGKIDSYRITPEEFGFTRARLEDLRGGSAEENAAVLLDILNGKPGCVRDLVVFNAACAIYAADRAASIKEGIQLAEEAIDSGKALKKLELLKEYSQRV